MKLKGSVYAGWFSLVCAGAFGASLVAYLCGLSTGDKHTSWLGPVIVSGVLALGAFAGSRIEDWDEGLNAREREVQARYEKAMSDIRKRRKALGG